MTTTEAPIVKRRPSAASRRFGYLVAIAVNAVVLWAAHRLLVWEWPGFLTTEFEEVLPLITASLIVSMVVNAAYLVRDTARVKALGDLINAGIGVAVMVRMWTVFPFDFAGYRTDWTTVFRVGLVLGIVGMSIAILANLVKLVTGDLSFDRSR